MNMRYQGEVSNHSTILWLLFFPLITSRGGLLEFTQLPHLSVAPLWLCIVLIWTPHIWVGIGTKKSLPLQNLFRQRAFVMCVWVHIQYEHNISTHKNSNSNRDVLTIHCHVYNSTSPGFSVMKKMLMLSQPLFRAGICQLSTATIQLQCASFP